jgi:Chaperone of endosialidase
MLGNLILETCNAPGTAADCLLLGPATGRLPFSFWFGSGAACFYVLADGTQEEWGIGTFHTGSPNTLTRTTVLKNSSGSTARLNFLGTTRVYNDIPAERSLWVDNANNVTIAGNYVGQNVILGTGSNGGAVQFHDNSRPVDNKFWDFETDSNAFYGRAVNDAYTASTPWLTVSRSGYTIASITFRATNGTTFWGDLSVQGGLIALNDVKVGAALYLSTINAGTDYRLWSNGNFRLIEFTAAPGWNLQFDARPAVNNLNYFNNNATALFWSEGSSGDLHVKGTVWAQAYQGSDARVKRDITPFTRGLREIVALSPVRFYFNGLGGITDDKKPHIGLIAQDVQPHIPEMVFATPLAPTDLLNTRADIVRDPRLPGQLSLDDRPLIYALINAARELSARVIALEDRVAVLERATP